jgi:toxin ParE1/3/4
MQQTQMSDASLSAYTRCPSSLLMIGRYTEKRWGRAQRTRYITALDRQFHLLAQMPHKGRARTDVAPELHSFPQGQHVIYYQIKEGGILIVDILHGRMDPELHLRF